MKKVKVVLMTALFVLGFVVFQPLTVKAADEGSPMMKMETNSVENAADTKESGVAMDEDCPVCLVAGAHMEGKDEFTAEYEGKTYKFESEEHKNLFLADPGKYVQAETKDANEASPAAEVPAPKGSSY